MKKVLVVLLVLVVLIAAAAGIAVWRGKAPVVSACQGDLPKGNFVAYRAQAVDGNCMQGYVWQPAGAVRGVVVVVHGLHDHARRYEALAQALNASGLAVVAQDQRGHGGSGGASQRLDSVQQLLADVDLARAQASSRYPQLPQFLYGHSLGGMVVAHHAAQHSPSWAGVIVSSAALKLPTTVTPGSLHVVSALSALAPGLGLEAVDEKQLVREPAQLASLAKDATIRREKLPARTVATLLQGIVSLQERMPQITAPLLVLHGQQDKVTDPAGSSLLKTQAGSKNIELRLYDGALHDLLHEPEAADVQQTINRFVQQRFK